MLMTVLMVLLLLALLGALPTWGYHNAGWGPSGGAGVLLVLLLLWLMLGNGRGLHW